MKLSDRGYRLVKKWEGYHTRLSDGRCRAYWDSYGRVWTIGWGCTRGIHQGMVWTKEQAQAMLEKEISSHETAVLQYVNVPMTQEHFDALVVFAYNVGNGNFKRSTLLRKLNKGDYDGAHAQFVRWNKAGRPLKVVRGLTNRRRDEALLFEEGTAKMEAADENNQMWWEDTEDGVTVAEPLPQLPEAGREPISKGTAVAATGAAGVAATAASNAPPETMTAVTDTMTKFSVFAGAEWTSILAICGVVAAVLGAIQVYKYFQDQERIRWL